MRTDIHDALLSVKEVTVFAWSLLELLLTRILPLASFLAGHLVLQFGQLLASVVIPTAGQRKPRAEYFGDVQAEELILIEEDNVQVVKEDVDDYQDDLESLKSTDKLEERQRRDEDGADHEQAGVAAAAEPVYQNLHVAKMTLPTANEAQMRGSDYESVAPSDVQRIASDAVANEVQARVNDHELIASIEQEDVSSKAGGGAGKMPSEATSSGTSEAATSSASSTEEGEMQQSSRRSRRRRMRVLPPSLSQVKRTLMQRSRRVSPSPHPSPAMAAPSPSPTKKQHWGSHRSASSAIKASSSYDNLMRKFRKQFLL